MIGELSIYLAHRMCAPAGWLTEHTVHVLYVCVCAYPVFPAYFLSLCILFFWNPSSTFFLLPSISGGGMEKGLGNFGMSTYWKCICACICIQCIILIFLLSSYPLHWSPLIPPTTDHSMTAPGNTRMQTHTHRHLWHRTLLFLEVPLGSWQLSLIYFLKLTLSVNERVCGCVWSWLCVYVCLLSITHQSHMHGADSCPGSRSCLHSKKNPRGCINDSVTTKWQPSEKSDIFPHHFSY